MSWLHVEMFVLDTAAALTGFAANWLVQSTALIALGLLAGWLFRRGGAALKSAVYRTTLSAVLVCPLITCLLAASGISGWSIPMPAAWTLQPPPSGPLVPDGMPAAEAPARAAAGSAAQVMPRSLYGAEVEFASRTESPQPPDIVSFPSSDPELERGSSTRLGSLGPSAEPASRLTAAPAPLLRVRGFGLVALVLAVAWLSMTSLLLLRLSVDWWRLVRLRRNAVQADSTIQRLCGDVARSVAVTPPPVLCSPYLTSPCLAGLWRPAVLLPDGMPGLSLRDVLVHELAHLRRHDHVWNLVRRVADAVFFFQPLLGMLGRGLEAAAEEVCDDYVVQLGGDREEYARRLTDIAELYTAPAPVAGIAMVSLRSLLAQRIVHILDTSRAPSTRIGKLLLVLVLAAGLTGTIVMGFIGLGAQPTLAQSLVGGAPESDDENERAASQGGTATADQPAAPSGDAGENAGQRGSAAADAADRQRGETAEAHDKEQAAGSATTLPANASNPIAGRVVGGYGKPVAGAKLYWIRSRVHDLSPQPPQLVATTGADGAFRFQPPAPADTPGDPASWDYTDQIVAVAPGHGFVVTSPGVVRRGGEAPQGLLRKLASALAGWGGATITLPEAGEPIRGRLVDINGQPAVGVRVRMRWFSEERDGLRSIREARARGVENAEWKARVDHLVNVIEPVQLREVFPSAVTDAEGRFELRDIGANRCVQLLLQGEGFEATEILAHNEPGEVIVVAGDRHERDQTRKLFPNEFVHAMGPSRPVEGRVLDLDSGLPISGAVVRAFAIHGELVHSSRERQHLAARTDAAGRYRITGLPIGKDNRLVAFTTGDVPYIPVGHVVDTSAQGAVTQQDFRLKRGVWAEGRVFDAETNRPFIGEITYYFFRNRELEAAIPGLRWAFVDGRYWTNANGEFRVPVLPTRGVLAYRYAGNSFDRDGIDRFPRGMGAEEISGAEDFGGAKAFPTLPYYLSPDNYERVAEVAPRAGEATVRVDMPLMASQPVKVRVKDLDGKPAHKLLVYGMNERFGWQAQEAGEFEVQDLRPREVRKVFALDRERNLVGGVFVKQGTTDVVEIQLTQSGSVRGRLVDADGEPIDDATINVDYDKLQSNDNSAIWAPHPELHASPAQIPVDKEGRFRLDGLIPEWTYHANVIAPRPLDGQLVGTYLGVAFAGVQVAPGETKELGDLVVGKQDRDEQDVRLQPVDSGKQVNTIRGRVTGPDGKPADGTNIALIAAVRGDGALCR